MKDTLRSGRSLGFTLVELLVVITIVGILVGLSIVGVSKALGAARKSQSLSNLRQIGIAMNLYIIDNNNYMPYVSNAEGDFWPTYIMDYFGSGSAEQNRKILICPVAEASQKVIDSATWVPTTYTMPDVYGSPNRLPHQLGSSAMNLNQIKRPSKMILVATGPQVLENGATTASFWLPWQGFQRMNMSDPATPIEEGFGGLDYRLDGKLGAVMVDGHVEMIERGQLTWANVLPTARDTN